jgi:heme-degrading monooxygenase HmoA
MLLKWIVCQVARPNRDRFSQAQEQWAAVAGLEGFVAQVGGWDLGAECQACIAALWRDAASYGAFMTGEHEAIVRRNGQARTYDASTTALFEVLWEIPGWSPSLLSALGSGAIMRTADCVLRPGRQDHFLQVQQSLWAPAMDETEGMLGGVFGRSRGAGSRYLVATLWQDRAAHESYVENRLLDLRAQASVERDLERIEGRVIALERLWRVTAVSGPTQETVLPCV